MTSEVLEAGSEGIRLKRAYEPHEASDGMRVLVDRLWPRGISKEAAALDAWMKPLGTSAGLRKRFGHEASRWPDFEKEYRVELTTTVRQLLLSELRAVAGRKTVTLVFGARNTQENQAVVLRDYLVQESSSPDDALNAPAKLLVTASAVAGAYHDAVAPRSGLKLFASSILSDPEFDAALRDLLKDGRLLEASGGWKISGKGQSEIRRWEAVDV